MALEEEDEGGDEGTEDTNRQKLNRIPIL